MTGKSYHDLKIVLIMRKTCNMHLWNMKGKASPPGQTGRKVAESQNSHTDHTDSLNRTPQVSVLGSNTRSPIEDHRNPWRSWISGHVISCHVLFACVKSVVKSVPHIFVTRCTICCHTAWECYQWKLCEDFRTLYQGVMPFSASWRNHI
jgi:hypothetical protein